MTPTEQFAIARFAFAIYERALSDLSLVIFATEEGDRERVRACIEDGRIHDAVQLQDVVNMRRRQQESNHGKPPSP